MLRRLEKAYLRATLSLLERMTAEIRKALEEE